MKMYRYSAEQKNFIREFAYGHSHKEITAAVNEKFKSDLTVSQITSFLKNNKIKTGRNGRFQKGNIPFNKGKKIGGWAPTQFNKGYRPANTLDIGTEILKGDGYVWVKIAEPNIWKQKHRIIWEDANGTIPENHVLIFADSNKLNVNLDNLILITRGELATMNKKKLISEHKELTEAGLMIAKIINKSNQLKGSK
ncbi:MAG: hypothetical protein PWQ06_90 [Anaerophaga sp.]|nr:hypothetical protein [Eubacteriaceae bacterium]MDN5289851.1 hypothetical protein [Anaerophaga sp.]